MKKSNKQRQALLQRKRTKRNQSRKGVKYDPTKLERRATALVQASKTSVNTTDDSKTVFTV